MNKTGVIANINCKYVILDERKMIKETNILYSLLPDDMVEYNIVDDSIVISKLVSRKQQYFMGIIRKIEFNLVNVYCQGFPKFFQPTFINNNYKLEDVVIIEANINSMSIHKVYDSIRNRNYDKDIILDLYKLNATTDINLQYNKTNNNFYTKEFQNLSHLNTFNVDPTNSKDFDDAISVDSSNNKIYVHIVDANECIPIGSIIEKNSFMNSFTLYLPEHIENILPKEMAENHHSLIKGDERRVVTVEYNIDSSMNIMSYDVYKSIIIIKERYDYNQFNKIINTIPFLVLFNNRWEKPSLMLPRVKLEINNTCCIENYYYETNFDKAHKVIETMMILTNMTISKHMETKLPQRFHQKSSNFRETENITNNNVIDSILTVKKYRNAIYDASNNGHFGLNLTTYTHFTSPIRRYFDVIVHRILAGYTLENINEIILYINKREREIDKLCKLYNTMKILDYMDTHKNKHFSGYVINKTAVGVVVLLEDFLYEVFFFTKNNYTLYQKIEIKNISINWLKLEIVIRD